MFPMTWHSLFAAMILIGKVVLLLAIFGVLTIGFLAQTQQRYSKYKKSRRFIDLLKIFSRY
jgi:hypothetical protein